MWTWPGTKRVKIVWVTYVGWMCGGWSDEGWGVKEYWGRPTGDERGLTLANFPNTQVGKTQQQTLPFMLETRPAEVSRWSRPETTIDEFVHLICVVFITTSNNWH